MLCPMMVLAGACLWIGLVPQTVTELVFLGGAYLSHLDISMVHLEQVLTPLATVVRMTLLFLGLLGGLTMIRRSLLGKTPMPTHETWGCGFAQVSSRVQYTAASFARLILDLMRTLLLFRRQGGPVTGTFPGKTRLTSSVHDAAEEMAFRPGLAFLNAISQKLGHSRIRYTQLYLMYILLFLIVLLVWKLK